MGDRKAEEKRREDERRHEHRKQEERRHEERKVEERKLEQRKLEEERARKKQDEQRRLDAHIRRSDDVKQPQHADEGRRRRQDESASKASKPTEERRRRSVDKEPTQCAVPVVSGQEKMELRPKSMACPNLKDPRKGCSAVPTKAPHKSPARTKEAHHGGRDNGRVPRESTSLEGKTSEERRRNTGVNQETDYNALLTALYTKHNPGKIKMIPALLNRYRGTEATMYSKICMKYGGHQSALTEGERKIAKHTEFLKRFQDLQSAAGSKALSLPVKSTMVTPEKPREAADDPNTVLLERFKRLTKQ